MSKVEHISKVSKDGRAVWEQEEVGTGIWKAPAHRVFGPVWLGNNGYRYMVNNKTVYLEPAPPPKPKSWWQW